MLKKKIWFEGFGEKICKKKRLQLNLTKDKHDKKMKGSYSKPKDDSSSYENPQTHKTASQWLMQLNINNQS